MITAGKIVYHLYFRPVAFIRKIYKAGIRRSLRQENGRREMIAYSRQLKEIHYQSAETFDVYFLTGQKYWYQTAFCLYSLQKYSGVNIHAFIIDDGSFDDKLEAQVVFQFPSATVIKQKSILEILEERLPGNEFPVLRKHRLQYPHLKKLTDIHILPGSKPKLVLDSDMLFFNKPVEFLQWLRQPDCLIFLKDNEESYGYNVSLMKMLAHSDKFPDKLNVGIAGIAPEKINWQQLELWTRELLQTEGSRYLLEQALTAMIATNHHYTFLNQDAYKVLPVIEGPVTEVLHHYVAASKYDYFVKAWRQVI